MKNEKVQIVRPFNPSFFNFLKIHPREVVLKVVLEPDDCRVVALASTHEAAVTASTGSAETAVPLKEGLVGLSQLQGSGYWIHRLVVNSSPLYRGHCLFIPEAERQHPQVLTAAGLLLGCRLATLAGAQPDLSVGFNSLGAWASVNHFHLHVCLAGQDMFCSGQFPLQHAAMKQIAAIESRAGAAVPPVSVWRTTDFPLTCFVFCVRTILRASVMNSCIF